MLERVGAPPAAARRTVRSIARPLLTAAGAVAALAVVAAVNPYDAGHYPTCPSLWLTGWYCPGCGSLRALHDLAHLDVAGAMGMNPLAVVVVPWLMWRWIAWMLAASGRPVGRTLVPGWVLYLLAACIVLYGVARNMPMFAPWLAP